MDNNQEILGEIITISGLGCSFVTNKKYIPSNPKIKFYLERNLFECNIKVLKNNKEKQNIYFLEFIMPFIMRDKLVNMLLRDIFK